MYAVILAGGSGTRFWPLSREEYPKQLLKLFGNQSLIQATLSRISDVIPLEKTYVVTNPQQAEQIKFQLAPTLEGPHFICEPVGRNTATAIGLAATVIGKKSKNDIMVVFSADHVIQHSSALIKALILGETLAKSDLLVTLGAKPTRPETAYGYIQKGESFKAFPLAFIAQRFIEKPNQKTAVNFLKNSNVLWNTGLFVWKVSTILQEIQCFFPELSAGLQEIEQSIGTERELRTIERIYSRLPAISIDYAVLEKSKKLAVLETDMGWEDVGSWNTLSELLPKDPDGNTLTGNTLAINSKNSIVYANKRMVAVLGLKDMVVADTDDATLVCSKAKAQDVSKVVELLKVRNSETHRTHKTVIRSWGSYTVLQEGDGYKVKHIVVNPKSQLSLQLHKMRSEHWVVISGTALVTCDEKVYTLQANQSTFVPIGIKHQLENPTDDLLQVIEVQAGSYLREDDIVRHTDRI